MTAQTGPYVGNRTPEGFINFALGQPSPRLLPLATIARAAGELGKADPLVLQYGATQGFVSFREALADFLAGQHGIEVAPASLALGGAISLSLGLLADVFGRRRGLVACEDPTYFLARGIFESSGMRSMGIPTDAEGILVDALAERIEAGEVPDIVYVIPTFQNPTGVVTSEARRRALVELAHQHDFIVVADEPYNLLAFGAAPGASAGVAGGTCPTPWAAREGSEERVISVSSFTKILAPGLRTGWWQASPGLLKRALRHGVLSSGGNLNPVMAQILLPLLHPGGLEGTGESSELAANLVVLRDELGRRCAALAEAVATDLPSVRMRRPDGGYFAWLEFPEGVDTEALRQRAKGASVGFYAGKRCAVEADLSRFARLSFAFYEPEEIREGIRRLATVVDA